MIQNIIGFTECGSCNIRAYIIVEKKYNGLRGNCPDCGGNWPES